jgi:Carboxypeptidase regulatory-like domain
MSASLYRVWRAIFSGISAVILLSFLTTILPAAAQIGGQGAISGTVEDSTGAVIADAVVTATNVGTGVQTTRTSSGSGYYLISPLISGEYKIAVSAKGFATLLQDHVTVDALQTVGFSPKLTLGSATDTVTVTDAPPALETENGTLNMTMEQKEYTNLPLTMSNGPRNPTSFVTLMPGVQSGGRSGEFSGSGSASYLDEVYIDGIPVTAAIQQGDNRAVAYTLAPEAIEQFQTQTSGSPVEFEGQGVQNYVVKSGTNEFHGGAFAFVRNTIFDTWGFGGKVSNKNALTGLPVKPVEHQIEWGAFGGGPIIKNRLFVFSSYDKYFFHSTPNPTQYTVPSALARTGDFTEYSYPVYDPSTTAACTAANGGVPCRTQFMGMKNGLATPNVIPTGDISPISTALAATLPAPNLPGLASNLSTAIRTGTNYWKTASRVDYDINHSQRLSGIILFGNYGTIGPDYTTKLPIPYGTTEYVSQFSITADAEHTWTINPRLVNQAKYAFNRLAAPDVNGTLNTPYTATAAGLTNLPIGEASSTFPAISFSGGLDAPQSWHAVTGSVSNNEVVNTFVLLDNLQWVKGSHALTFGGQMQWLQDNYKYPNNSTSFPLSYSFSNAEVAAYYPKSNVKQAGTIETADTGLAYASFLIGSVGSSTLQTTSLPESGARYKTYAPYIQDDYKVNKNLTVNLGLRWEIWTPFHEVRNRSSYFDPTAINPITGNNGALRFYGSGPNSCNCSSNVPIRWRNLAPRLGFAFSANSKTVFRGSYGISYARQAAEGGHNSGARTGPSQQGFAGSTVLTDDSQGRAAFFWDGKPASSADSLYGTGSFPGAVPVLPNTDPSQQTGYSSLINSGANGGSLGYGDPITGQRVPYFHNFSFGIQRALSNSTTIQVNYVGSAGHFVPGPVRGYWSDKLDPRYLALGSLLTQTATATTIAQANAIIPGIALPYTSFSGKSATIAQALIPFPQYNGISDVWGNVGNTSFNSMQIMLAQRTWQGVTFNVNYTYAKAIGDVDTTRGGYPLPVGVVVGSTQSYAANRVDRTWQSNAQKERLVVYGVWEVPFGNGKRFSGGPAFVRPITTGWQLSSIFQYNSGAPLQITASTCTYPSQFSSTCVPNLATNYSGPVRQNGSLGSNFYAGGTSPVYMNSGGFQSMKNFPYLIGNAPDRAPFNLWAPGTHNFDASVRKNFPIWENVKLTFQADCFNVENKVTFGYASTSIDSTSFGQTNLGSGNRDWQFAGHIDF